MTLERMIDVLPRYYEEIREVNELIGAEASQLNEFNNSTEDILRQFTVDTATWGLERWERLVGLDRTQEGVEERRSAIKSKLQGYGTMTASKIKEICKLYTSGTVDVQVNGPAFTVTVTFTDLVGIPPNYAVLERVLREVLPAHLVLEFGFRYMRWSELDAFGYTWNVLDGLGMSWDEFSEAVS